MSTRYWLKTFYSSNIGLKRAYPRIRLFVLCAAAHRRKTVRIDIKSYVGSDLDRMMTIWRAATVVAHDFQTAADLDRDEAMIRNEFVDKTESWTAWDGDRMVGFISLMGEVIVALFVDPKRHRGGIGSALIGHVNSLHGPLCVEVFAENRNGIAFYEKNGFRFRSEEEMPHYPGHVQWIMAQPGAREAQAESID